MAQEILQIPSSMVDRVQSMELLVCRSSKEAEEKEESAQEVESQESRSAGCNEAPLDEMEAARDNQLAQVSARVRQDDGVA